MTTETEIPEGCLAFDLEKARAGHPCRTSEGLVARYLGEVGAGRSSTYHVVWDMSSGYPETTTEEGRAMLSRNHREDVFLTAPKKVKREAWANMFNAPNGGISFPQSYLEGKLFATEAEARRHNGGGDFRTTCKIEWEETEHDNK